MNDIIKIVKYLEECGLLIKEKICKVIEKIKKWGNKQKGGFPGMLFTTLGVRLLGNLVTGKGTVRAVQDF